MNKNALTKVKKKYWAWQRYQHSGAYNDYQKYVKIRNQAQSECIQLRRNFEHMIANEIKTNPKSF